MDMSTKEATIAGATEIMCQITNYISKKKYGVDLEDDWRNK